MAGGESATRLIYGVPVPVSFAVCGEALAVSVIVKVPVKVPVPVGLKATRTSQFAAGGSVAPQLFNWINEEAFVPEIAMPEMSRVEAPVFVRVTG